MVKWLVPFSLSDDEHGRIIAFLPGFGPLETDVSLAFAQSSDNVTPPQQTVFSETWESSPMGAYLPQEGPSVTHIDGDEGQWLLGDTISNFPEDCGATPQTAEIIPYGDGKALRLTSKVTNTECSGNIFWCWRKSNPTTPVFRFPSLRTRCVHERYSEGSNLSLIQTRYMGS